MLSESVCTQCYVSEYIYELESVNITEINNRDIKCLRRKIFRKGQRESREGERE